MGGDWKHQTKYELAVILLIPNVSLLLELLLERIPKRVLEDFKHVLP